MDCIIYDVKDIVNIMVFMCDLFSYVFFIYVLIGFKIFFKIKWNKWMRKEW